MLALFLFLRKQASNKHVFFFKISGILNIFSLNIFYFKKNIYIQYL